MSDVIRIAVPHCKARDAAGIAAKVVDQERTVVRVDLSGSRHP